MRAVVQRVKEAEVRVEGRVVGRCGAGLLVLVAAHRDDTHREAAKMADRVWGLRIFDDPLGKMNLALRDFAGSDGRGVLAVSNFTVYGDATQRRPSFVEAAPYERGKELFERFVAELAGLGCIVQTGRFGAMMEVALINDGPVTVILDVPPGKQSPTHS